MMFSGVRDKFITHYVIFIHNSAVYTKIVKVNVKIKRLFMFQYYL